MLNAAEPMDIANSTKKFPRDGLAIDCPLVFQLLPINCQYNRPISVS